MGVLGMRPLWTAFVAVNVVSFAVLGWVGSRIYQQAPPVPREVVATDGTVVIADGDVMRGQHVWQSMGGMEFGSVWGHGSYVAPDWTADWLHRECLYITEAWAQRDFGGSYAGLGAERQAALQSRLKTLMRANTYDPATGRIVVDPVRAEAFEANLRHYAQVFSEGDADYAIPEGAQSDPTSLRRLAGFFFWTSWAASTNRPGDTISYTGNWPHEDFVDNHPSGEAVVWTGVSVIMLLAGICALVWYYSGRSYARGPEHAPESDPLIGAAVTPSQRAVVKYFWVVAGLLLAQIAMGVLTAHYGVEGQGLYGVPMARWIPYAVARTWHLQLGLFWIATAWLASGLIIGPVVSGVEPKGQRLGVNVLFAALLVVVVGSLAGEWMSIEHRMTGATSFYFGHQGYEYIDLGRVWQIGLFAGLLLWLFLVVRAVWPAMKERSEQRPLLGLFIVSAAAIGGLYGAGLMWGRSTPLSIAEYWRWWVVHLWVEGFFEVFATVVIAFFFTRLKLVKPRLAAEATLLSGTIYLAGGIIGTLHHLYWSGTPTVALAWGSVFSALEVVPLVLVAFPAWEDIRVSRAAPWVRHYGWPIRFFLAVAFWNMVGAGLFGFMINPPIALYYMQGLNTTPVHGHGALFGVYGTLGVGLMLFAFRALRPGVEWKDGLLRVAFWGMNVGLAAMLLLSLLPVGLLQTWAAVQEGYWYARSPEFLDLPYMQTLRWMRIPGDTVFAIGAVALVLFVIGLYTGHSVTGDRGPGRDS
jgi:nitric oxide reductase subunit B